MPIKQIITEGLVPVAVFTDEIEISARRQLANLSQLPIVHHHVAAMPDVHAGIGATVGTVIATDGAVIPAAVGVDIGCGMIAARTTLTAEALDERSLRRVYDRIVRDVPTGRDQHPDDDIMVEAAAFGPALEQLLAQHPAIGRNFPRTQNWARQMGTLGGGNHFIELCLDEEGRAWIMLHSGSRGIGNAIGTYFIELARRDMERQHVRLPDRDLAYLREGAAHFDEYIAAVGWAQDYAAANRRSMTDAVLAAMRSHLPPFELAEAVVNCHHNYVERERHYGKQVWVTRKGAIRAREGELGVIPGSMGAKSYIVRGKGVAESFHSCAHGAGRRLSRGAARKAYTTRDLAHQTAGVVCRKDGGVLDEIPAAYKDIDIVMGHQSDLVEVVHTLKQVLCVKG